MNPQEPLKRYTNCETCFLCELEDSDSPAGTLLELIWDRDKDEPDFLELLQRMTRAHFRPMLHELCRRMPAGNSNQALYCATITVRFVPYLPLQLSDLELLARTLEESVSMFSDSVVGDVLAALRDEFYTHISNGRLAIRD